MPLTADFEKKTLTCPVHGDVTHNVGWLPCSHCDDGLIDPAPHDDDVELQECSECRGAGGHLVCGFCNADNEDILWCVPKLSSGEGRDENAL